MRLFHVPGMRHLHRAGMGDRLALPRFFLQGVAADGEAPIGVERDGVALGVGRKGERDEEKRERGAKFERCWYDTGTRT